MKLAAISTNQRQQHKERTKMKHKLSITIDEKAVFDILKTIERGRFRNKSHFVEYAVKKLLEEENG